MKSFEFSRSKLCKCQVNLKYKLPGHGLWGELTAGESLNFKNKLTVEIVR